MPMPSKMPLIGLAQVWLLAAFAGVSARPTPDSAETCGSGDAPACPSASESDDAGLFQLRRSVAAKEGMEKHAEFSDGAAARSAAAEAACLEASEHMAQHAEMSEGAAAKAAAAEKASLEELSRRQQEQLVPPIIGVGTVNWWNLPVQKSVEQLTQCAAQLSNKFGLGGAQFGYIPGKDGPRLAYECTFVPGLSDQIPEKLRGVFWMKGNIMNEELVVLQNGQWFPEERKLIMPLSPFNWAWAGIDGTRPRRPPGFGLFYRNQYWARFTMLQLVANATCFTFQFSRCPGRPSLPWPFGLPGHACRRGSGNPPELAYAELAAHFWGMLENENQNGQYTMELHPRGGGESWLRGIYTRVFGLSYDLTSYDLVRILDGDGNPVEPHHSEYMRYIGNANLAFWYNYTDPEVMPLLKEERLREAWKLMWEGYCSQVPTPTFC